uniref:Putative basic tail protein n=1 Tax=Ixodes ricinus TaxID=34613 RepID=A0A0K8R540_IXORI
MGLTGITLVLVSLAFFGSAAAHGCQNGTRPASEENREGCDYYCWNADTRSWDKFFFGNGERCFGSSAKDIHSNLGALFGDNSQFTTLLVKWHRRF